jgi:endonuclease-3
MQEKQALRQMKELERYSKNMRLAAEQWKNDYEILISIILSARTRDEITIKYATELFKKYPDSSTLSKADLNEVKSIIKPINFYNNKSKNIIACSKSLIDLYKGKVPYEFDNLIKLSGVGRKTANVFLSEVGDDAIGVDTHVQYISQKLGWTNNKDPKKIEIDLKHLFSKKHWNKINPTAVRFGKSNLSRKKKDEILKNIREKI